MRIQRYSSYAFSVFAGLHFANTAVIPLLSSHSSPSAAVLSADSYLLLTRPLYQQPVAEALLIAVPLGLHIGSGIALRVYQWRFRSKLKAKKHSGSPEWVLSTPSDSDDVESSAQLSDEVDISIMEMDRSREPSAGILDTISSLFRNWPSMSGVARLGYVLLPFLAGHVLMNRVAPLLTSSQGLSESVTGLDFSFGGSSSIVGLEYVAHGFARNPVFSSVGYAVLIGSASWHVVWGWARWLDLAPRAGTVQHILPPWLVPSQSLSRPLDMRPSEMGTGGMPGTSPLDKLSVIDRRNRRRWWLINGTAAVMTGVWMASAFGVVARAGEADGWVGKEFDRISRGVPVIGAYL